MKVEFKQPDCIYTVQLTATRDELRALVSLFNVVSGSPKGPRGMIDTFRKALEKEIGSMYPNNSYIHDYMEQGNVRMRDEWPKN